MKKSLNYFLFFLLCVSSIQGQSQNLFQKYFGAGSMGGRKVITTPSGYFIIGTVTISPGNKESIVVKTDFNGNISWTQVFGNLMYETVSDAIISTDGFLIITGNLSLNSWDASNIFIVKMDTTNGNILWGYLYDMTMGDYSVSINETIDMGFILSGFVNSSQPNIGGFAWKSMLLKIDSSGQLAWMNYFFLPFTSSFESHGYHATSTRDSMYALVGNKRGTLNATDTLLYLFKGNWWGYSGISNIYQFANTGLQPSNSSGTCVLQNDAGDLIISGYLHGNDSTGLYRQIPFIAKTDSAGNLITSKKYSLDISGKASLSYIQKHPVGGYLACGNYGTNSILLLKIDENLQTEWCYEYSLNNMGNEFNWPKFDFTSNNGIVIVTSLGAFNQQTTILLTTDSVGHAACNYQIPLLQGVSSSITDTMMSITTYVASGGSKSNLPFTTQSITISDSLLCDAIVTLPDNIEDDLFFIYPNPSNDIIKLKLNKDTDKINKITVINAIGSEIYLAKPRIQSEDLELNINILNPGIYILCIDFENKKYLRKRLVKY